VIKREKREKEGGREREREGGRENCYFYFLKE
jgi:hypothetical protein